MKNPRLIRRSKVGPLLEKAAEGMRLELDEAVLLFREAEPHALAAAAVARCQTLNGNRVTYIVNRYINYTNYCILNCPFCSFARKRRNGDGFELTVEEIVQRVRQALNWGITEVHIVGGLHPTFPFSYYVDMIRALRELSPTLTLKCFTAIEILHLARLSRQSPVRVLEILREAGLDMLTGGGAEIFAPEVRNQIARGKETAEEWLEIHRQWHRLGGRSTCTMLFGHLESLEDRVDHLARLRALQDETGGFVGFVPLPYQPRNNRLPIQYPPTGWDTVRTIAISRLFLDNLPHITAYWIGLGLKLAQVAIGYGADDLHGTIEEEYVFHMAGADSPPRVTEQEMIRMIRKTGREPVRRDSFYRPLQTQGTEASSLST